MSAQRGPRKCRRPRPVQRRIAVGRDLPRVLDRQRRAAPGQEADRQRALVDAERAGRRRALEGRLAGLDEGLLPSGVELAVALQAAAVAVDPRQVVPDAQQVAAAGLLERGEEIAVGPLGQRRDALPLEGFFQLDRAERPVAVAAPAYRAGGAGFDVFTGLPDVGHRTAGRQHAGVDAGHPGQAGGRAVAEAAEGCAAAVGEPQAVGQGQALHAQRRRVEREPGRHWASTMFSPASGPRSRMLRRRRCQACQVRFGWAALTAK